MMGTEVYILLSTYLVLGTLAIIFATPRVIVHVLLAIAVVSIVVVFSTLVPLLIYAGLVAVIEIAFRRPYVKVHKYSEIYPEVEGGVVRISNVLDVVTPWSTPRRLPPKLREFLKRAVLYSDIYTAEVPEWVHTLLKIDGLEPNKGGVKAVALDGTRYNIRLFYPEEHAPPRRPAGGGEEAVGVFDVEEV